MSNKKSEDSVEKALKKGELDYRALFETMTEGVALHQMIYDDEGKAVDYLIMDVNSSFEKNLNIPVEKAKGALGSKLYQKDSPPYLDIYEQVVRTGKPYFFKTYFPELERYFEISIFSPGKDWFATLFLDVTGFHNSQEELRKAKKEASFLSDLVENSSQPFTISYPDESIGKVNHAFTLLTGYSKEELSKMRLSGDLTPPEWATGDEARMKELVETGQPVRYEKEYTHRDGHRVQVEIFKHMAVDDKGEPELFYSFVTDISIRKKAEEELKNLNKVLEVKIAEKTSELQGRVTELERFYKATIDREFRIKELNDYIACVEKELKEFKKPIQ
jgi:PAS domain S-box-containing protein